MAKKTQAEIDTANEILYSGDELAKSQYFSNCMWAASVVLKPDEHYTLSDAKRRVDEWLNRKVG